MGDISQPGDVMCVGKNKRVGKAAVTVAGQRIGVPVVIEVLVLRVREDGLRYCPLRQSLLSPPDPDAAAKALCGPGAALDLLHSTSWREENGTIILTYVAVTDLELSRPGRIVSDEVAIGDGPSAPAPEALELGEVAAHACRHLAFLGATDPHVAAALQRHPELRRHVNSYLPAVAGELSQAA